MIWNWTWNCKDDPTPVDLPDPPPDATRIVINWNWDCEGVDPPPLSAASVTDCTGCNIVINVRVASPGDSGDVTQTTQVEATSVTAGVAEATQAAAQTVVPPQPPVVSPPAPPQIVVPAPAVPVTALVDPVRVPSPDPPVIEPPPPPAAPVDVLQSAPPDATPGHATRPARHLRKPRPAKHRAFTLNRVAVSTVTRTVSVVRVRTVVRWHTRTAKPASRTHHPPFLPAPSAPAAPATFVPAVSEPHGNSAFTPLALSAGAIGALLLMFLAYAAPGLQTVRPRPAQANPDPPG